MIKKILGGFAVFLVIFLGYVSSKNGNFDYERNGLINATPEKIFPLMSTFAGGQQWNPYSQKDPNMKINIKGTDGAVGAVMEFDGNSEAGSGSIEITKVEPNQMVEMKLMMTKPMKTENMIQYKLTSEGALTRFSWRMYGDGGFMGKLMATLIDCEKMVTKDFVVGIENLKKVAESQK